jgi:hypothetical protein
MFRSSALAVLAAAAACAPPVRTAPSPVERAAKEFRATPGMTTLYVFRDAQQFETGMSDGERMSLELDGDPLGVTIARTFLVTVVSPGPHELVSVADNRSALRFDGRPDEIVYVYQDAKYLVSRTTRLERVEAASAQRRIQRCYLVASAPRRAAPQFLPPVPPRS